MLACSVELFEFLIELFWCGCQISVVITCSRSTISYVALSAQMLIIFFYSENRFPYSRTKIGFLKSNSGGRGLSCEPVYHGFHPRLFIFEPFRAIFSWVTYLNLWFQCIWKESNWVSNISESNPASGDSEKISIWCYVSVRRSISPLFETLGCLCC
jgi:hypothetical protein